MARRKIENENIRSLNKVSGGKSYGITLPIAVIRAFRWQEHQKLEITIDEKGKRLIIKDWKEG
jgi:bifunctional DNA-binding transcriptional regulator/antitoxin component of YhaV-PrlF toxin-antitoxin module